MAILDAFKRSKIEHKAMAGAANGGAYLMTGGPDWKPPSNKFDSYIDEGYQSNPVIYRAANEIATGASKIEVELYDPNGERVDDHPVLDLLGNPNPVQTFDEFLSELVTNDAIMGEQFIWANAESNPTELWSYCPKDIEVKKGEDRGIPGGYMVRKDGGSVVRTFEADEMLFRKRYNPKDAWRGQSPLQAVALQGDTFNAGSKWNWSLLKNSAAPSGIISFRGQLPTDDILSRMREGFKRMFSGYTAAGEIPYLADGATFTPMAHSPKDMDYATTLNMSAKFIATVMGVPLPLVDNDASTFNNMEQAKERLYTDTVIPQFTGLLHSLNAWLLPKFGLDGYELKPDLDSIPALEALRQRRFDRAIAAYEKGVLTIQETREMIGYQPDPDGDLKQTLFDQIGKTGSGGSDPVGAKEIVRGYIEQG